jgi:6-phosphofructokinase 1
VKIGVLTGGADVPGLNAVIRSIVKTSISGYRSETVGILNGFGGLLAPPEIRTLSLADVRGLVRRGGTILGTSTRNNPFSIEGRDRSREVLESVRWLGIDALVVIGGDGTFSIARRLGDLGLKIVGVPKAIENDIRGTVSFGWDTAVATAADAIDKLQTTGESHQRVMLLEVRGRNAGWVALASGIAGGADVILIPELPYRVEKVVEKIRERERAGRDYSVVVVAEGAHEEGGSPARPGTRGPTGAADRVGRKVGELTGLDWRVTVLGHLQHGGTPTPFDRVLASRLGAAAVRACHEGAFGRVVCLNGANVSFEPFDAVVGSPNRVKASHELVWTAHRMGISLGAEVEEGSAILTPP